MKEKEKETSAFLSGGGEMGELIRSHDWAKTSLGAVDTWPESLRCMVGVMLDSPFAMYIAWGKEYIQLYNDGYRPILGSAKHPQALGISTRETFAEVWSTIGPMFEGVMQGTPVGFPNFILHLNRNGFLEECFFDFSYSPIRLIDGKIGGVLVTVIETTEKVKAAKALKEHEQELQFAIDATVLATWDFNPATNKFSGNNRLRDWFGLDRDEDIELPIALAVIVDDDRDRVLAAIEKALQYGSGGLYDIEYDIVNRSTSELCTVRAKGRAWFNDDKVAYRFNGTLQDITKEIAARRLLIKNEQLLSNERIVLYNSFMNAPAAIAIVKGDTFIYEFANAEYEKILDRKITIGKTVEELFPEMEQQGIVDLLKNVFTTGVPFIANEFPVELINHKTGKLVLRYYNTVVQPITDENGNIERLLSHGVEVTPQVVARKQIEEANQALRVAATLTDNIADAVVGTDMDYKTISWNKGAENLYGYTSEEVMGKAAMGLLHTDFLTDDDRNAWQESLDTIGKWHGEVVQSKKDGTLVNVLVSIAYVHDVNGKPIAAVGVNRDITQRKRAEEKLAASEKQFRLFADSIQSLAWIANADGWIYWYNQRWYDFTGTTFKEMQGWGWGTVHHPDHIEGVVSRVEKLWEKAEAFEMTFPLKRHDGVYRWFLTRAFPVKDDKGEIERWIGTNTDITEQKNFAEELEKKVAERTEELDAKNIQLEISNAELASFNYIASHDLKEPLRKIQTFSRRILEVQKFSEETQHYFNRIIASGERMQSLIDSLLDFSRASTAELVFETCDLNAIVKESISDLEVTINEKQAVINRENLPIIKGVSIQLSQLFTNLIENSIKYSRPDVKPVINITTSIIEGKDIGLISAKKHLNYHEIKIADNGIGFETAYADKIFQLFQRLHHQNEYSGTGIGLSIVKKIVENHDGFVIAQGAPDEGSTFSIYIPTIYAIKYERNQPR